MANQNESAQELLFDIKIAEASRLYKLYLNQEKKILGSAGVLDLFNYLGARREYVSVDQSHVHERSFALWKAAVQLFSSGEIYNDLYVSGIELFWGYLLSAAVAVPFGIMVGWYKKTSYIFDPFINAMNATPRVALLPLVIIWLGIGISRRSALSFSAQSSRY